MRILGITVFGWITIATVPLYALLHHWMVTFSLGLTYPHPIGSAVALAGILSVAGVVQLRLLRTRWRRLWIRFGFVWTGYVFLYGMVLLPTVWLPLPRPAAPLMAFGLALWGLYNAFVPHVQIIQVPAAVATPVRLTMIADLHLGDFYTRTWLGRIVESVNTTHPDLILLPGDLTDGMEPLTREDLSPLAALAAPAYFVNGNHESYIHNPALYEALRHYGITLLNDTVAHTEHLTLAGIDYHHHTTDSHSVLEAIREATKPVVVLKHKPHLLAPLAAAGASLIVSGHTHNGQIWPLGLLCRIEFPIAKGIKRIGNTTLYVTEGTGTWGPPYRIGTRSEITVIDLQPLRDTSGETSAA